VHGSHVPERTLEIALSTRDKTMSDSALDGGGLCWESNFEVKNAFECSERFSKILERQNVLALTSMSPSHSDSEAHAKSRQILYRSSPSGARIPCLNQGQGPVKKLVRLLGRELASILVRRLGLPARSNRRH